MDRHLRKLDQELAKFKMELEADNAGITEILEQSKIVYYLIHVNEGFLLNEHLVARLHPLIGDNKKLLD